MVNTFCLNEFLMFSPLCQSAFTQYIDPVSVADCGETMGNNNRGSGLWNCKKGLLDRRFRFVIYSGSRLVQNEGRRCVECCPGGVSALCFRAVMLLCLSASDGLMP